MTRLFTLIILFSCVKVFSQTCPPNLDFELGDFKNWQCSIGTTSVDNSNKNIIALASSPPTTGRHQIFKLDSLNAKDEFGGFPKLCPYGGKYSVKLGNTAVGGEAEGISYTFIVPPGRDTFTFTYFYAVVFEDPGHESYEQPRFFVTAYEVTTGALINCASYNYVASGGIPGFQVSKYNSGVLYKNWSPVSIQFAGLGGQKVRLEFKTADCTKGGHFGYAYLDVADGCSNVLATAPYCAKTNSLLLNAPYGFQTYTWYNDDYTKVMGTDQSLTLSPPPATSGTFHVDLIPYPNYGCRDTADAMVVPLPVPDTPVAKSPFSICQYNFGQQLTATPDRGSDLLWYTTPSGGTPDDIAPYIATSVPGSTDYYVSQKVLFGCESPRKKIIVDVNPVPLADFSINDDSQCENGNVFRVNNLSSNLFKSAFTWSFGDGTSSADTSAVHTYKTYGYYPINLKVENPPTCASTITKYITVVPKPVASFNYPQVVCEKQTLFTLSNTSFISNNLSAITTNNWTVNGIAFSGFTPTSFVPSDAGDLPVSLQVISKEGCTSDLNAVNIKIHHRPNASFQLNQRLICSNEVIRLLDQSAFGKPVTGEQINKWSWQMGAYNASVQNPALILPAGNYDVQLVSESNFGCISLPFVTRIQVNPKPLIGLTINDSCVFRTINYKATDLTGDVQKWLWNLGNGFYTGKALISQTFNKEGNHPLTLIGQTSFGCKDTIIRPFTIYDNKAFAGKDTIAAMGQPVQLDARGGPNNFYTWSPATGLNNTTIEKPVATLDYDERYKLDAITDKGCDAHSSILIKRFKGPDLYIASAFTPDYNGLNDVLHVFPVGILTFESFAIFNRYGQRVFFTTDYKQGWDGKWNTKVCDAGSYVAVAVATDYKGKKMTRTVNVALIR